MVEAYFSHTSAANVGERQIEGDGQAGEVTQTQSVLDAANAAATSAEPKQAEPRPSWAPTNGQASTSVSEARLDIPAAASFSEGVRLDSGTRLPNDMPSPANSGEGSEGAPREEQAALAGAPGTNGMPPEPSSASAVSTNGVPRAADEAAGAPDLVETLYTGPFPNFSGDALDCLNRAAKLAYDLNHTCISSAHLLLAMTLDQRSRKMLERVGDVGQLRQGAMQVIGRMHWRYSEGRGEAEKLPNAVTADLWDIFEAAKHEADDRQQEVSTADLIRAFPKGGPGEELTYGAEDDYAAVPQVIDRVEKGLTPRLTDFMMNFEYQLQQRTQQILEGILNEFGAELRDRLSTVIAAAQAPRPVSAAPPPPTSNPIAGTAPTGVTTTIPPRTPEPEDRHFLGRLFGRAN